MKTASSRAYLPLTVSVAIFALAAIFVTGCGGGSGGGGGKDHSISFNGGSWESNFFLQDVHFGRALVDGQGIAYQVINPLTYVEVDPITGILLPGYPRLLFEDDELGNLMSSTLSTIRSIPTIPRSCRAMRASSSFFPSPSIRIRSISTPTHT